eukprot:GHVP01057231.1.p1 GENE.GHVP01057231.1~~GHVP01057231.1.p1  ORF type:complete len:224 (+),score=38.89 GHVP01057231.1:18-689(+)
MKFQRLMSEPKETDTNVEEENKIRKETKPIVPTKPIQEINSIKDLLELPADSVVQFLFIAEKADLSSLKNRKEKIKIGKLDQIYLTKYVDVLYYLEVPRENVLQKLLIKDLSKAELSSLETRKCKVNIGRIKKIYLSSSVVDVLNFLELPAETVFSEKINIGRIQKICLSNDSFKLLSLLELPADNVLKTLAIENTSESDLKFIKTVTNKMEGLKKLRRGRMV